MSSKHIHNHEICNGNEKRTLIVILLTIITMIAEVIYGYYTNSMALLADGYHMGTHVFALGLTYMAYVLTRKLAASDKFINGPEKIGTLAAYTSSIFLGLTGIWIIFEAIFRIFHPLKIEFSEAILVAIIGFSINVICIYIIEGKHACHKKEWNEGPKNQKDRDYNLKAAYYHILADILTSIFAITALLIGKFFHITALDSLSGIFGGILILRWAKGLLQDTIKVLLDMKC